MELLEASYLLRQLGFWTKIKHLPRGQRPIIFFWDEDIRFEVERILQMLAFTPYEKIFGGRI